MVYNLPLLLTLSLCLLELIHIDGLNTWGNIANEDFEAEKAKERIQKGTYTLEYQFFSTEEYDAYAEFNSLKELEKYLNEHKEIEKYSVLDCYMNEIGLK